MTQDQNTIWLSSSLSSQRVTKLSTTTRVAVGDAIEFVLYLYYKRFRYYLQNGLGISYEHSS